MLDQINISKLAPIAAGINGAAYTDGTYAVKFGNITESEVNILKEAYMFGLAVKIHWYASQVELPVDLYRKLQTLFVDSYGDDVTIDDYVLMIDDIAHADVLIMDLAIPLTRLSPNKDSSARRAQMQRITDRLYKKILRVMDFLWIDNHPGNVGIYNGKAVMLDV